MLSFERRNINFFAALRDDYEENADDKATDSITEDETSIDLLVSQSKAPSQKKMMFDKIRSTLARHKAQQCPQRNITSPSYHKCCIVTKGKNNHKNKRKSNDTVTSNLENSHS